MDIRSQINGGSLVSCDDLESLNLDGGYSMVPLVHDSWKTSKKRLLVVVETVDGLDIHNGCLLSGTTEDNFQKKGQRSNHNPMRSVLSSIPDLSRKMLKSYGFDPKEHFAFGVVNFNACKIRSLDPSKQVTFFPSFTSRVLSVIAKLKPTHLLVCGDTASYYLLTELNAAEGEPEHLSKERAPENSRYKRGWVFNRTWKGTSFTMVPTLDLESLYNPPSRDDEDEDEGSDNDRYAAADLLFFVARNMMNLFAGKMLHDLSGIKPNPVYVDTVEKFDSLYKKLLKADRIALDTETKSLANSRNALYMAQFAFSRNRGYVVPIRHPKGPFTEEQADYIEGKLRAFLLSKKNAKTLIFFNGTFDTRIYRTRLGLSLIPYHRIHEITAGEQLLDENLSLFTRMKMYFNGRYEKRGTSYGNLRGLFSLYGNDWYWVAKFSKEERNLLGNSDPTDPDVLAYATMDVQSLFGMAEEQEKIAYHQMVKPSLQEAPVRYSDYFSTHLLNQMSNTVQSISHMEQNGSPMDIKYLNSLLGKDSPLLKLMKDTTAELSQMPAVKETNKRLLNGSGKATTSLFGDDIAVNVFNPNKREHKDTLLFDVLKLKPINLTKTGLRGTGKAFIAAYKDKYKEVAALETLSKTSKLLSTYVRGWIKQMMASTDSAIDFCLRPAFGFFTIVTGRLNSFKPSLQQVPSHGKLAEYIKRAFLAPVGHLTIKYDYSAHEIRGWSILSGDKAVANSFQMGLDLRRKLIRVSDVPPLSKDSKIEELKKELLKLKKIEKDLMRS